MKKGIGPIALLLLGLFGTLVIGGIAFVSLYSRTVVTKRAMFEINIINAINKFELSRTGLSKALEYSFYEASYLTSPMGGYYKLGSSVDSYGCIPYWRDYDSEKYPGFDYTGRLMLEALKVYVEEINNEVDIPEYEYSEVEILDDSLIRVEASSGEKLSLKRDRATVEIDALETALTTNIGEMYKTAKENFIENDIIQEKIQEAIGEAAVPKSISVGDICENELDPESILGANSGNWESDIEDEIERKINELSNELTNDDVEVDIELLEVSVSYEPECSHVAVVEDEPSCCKETYSVDCGGGYTLESECVSINYCNPYFVTLPTYDVYNGCYCDNETHDPVDQVELCEGCEEYYRYLQDVTCTYNYYASAWVLFEIKDTSNQFYPVMGDDKDVEFKPIILKFYVLSGNDYDHKIDAVTDSKECEVEVLDLTGNGKPPGDPSPPPIGGFECGTLGRPITDNPSNECLARIGNQKDGVSYPAPSPYIKIWDTNPSNSESCDSPHCMYEFTHDLEKPYLDVYDTSSSVRDQLEQEIRDQLETVNLFGCTVRVHKNVANLYREVSEELTDKYFQSRTTYDFPSGTYTFDCTHTGGFNFRYNVNNPSVLSPHAFGLAVDINWQQNWGNVITSMACDMDIPPEVVETFENKGFRWGGRFWPSFDPMHFEYIPSCITS